MVSTRRSQSDKKRDYQVGDKVEVSLTLARARVGNGVDTGAPCISTTHVWTFRGVDHGTTLILLLPLSHTTSSDPLILLLREQVLRIDGVATGTLLYKTETVTSSHQPHYESSPSSSTHSGMVSHWMVAVSDHGGQEEDISERRLGRVFGVDGGEEHTSTTSSTAVESDSSGAMALNTGKVGRKRAPRKRQTAKAATAVSKSKTVVKATPPRVHSTRAVTRSAGPAVELFRGIEEIPVPPKQPKAPRQDKDSNVVKIEMLTGVLYMYREMGCKRHVRFVRTK